MIEISPIDIDNVIDEIVEDGLKSSANAYKANPETKSKNRRKFDRATLLEFIADNGVVMDLIPNECTRDTKVSGQCVTENCNNRFEKPVRGLFDYGGPYCKNCTEKNKKVKFRETCVNNLGVEHPLQSEEIKQKMRDTWVKNLGVENPMQNEEIKQKMRETNVKNLGVEHASQSEVIKQKMRETNVKNLGVENPFQSEEIKQKIRETNVKNLGVENPLQSEEIKQKVRETSVKNYGVEYPMQNEEIKQKRRETSVKNLGVEHALQSEEIKQKFRETCVKNLGVEHPSQSEEIKQKKRETCVKNLGVENPFQSEEIKQKMRETSVKNYGVEYPMQDPDILNQAQKARFKRKIYKTPTGQLWDLQGYEHLVAPKLIEEYGEENIIPELKEVPRIQWVDENGQMHYYFCDFYVEPHKLVVEVKSTWTQKVDDEKIQRTRRAANDLGYAFRLIVVDGKGELIEDNTFEGVTPTLTQTRTQIPTVGATKTTKMGSK